MRFIRVLFITLLCMVLPISGMAATGVVMDCPIPSAMQWQMAAQADDNASASMDCMQSMEEMSASPSHSHSPVGKNVHCKLLLQCQVSSQYVPVPATGVDAPLMQPRKLVFHYAHTLPALSLSDLWRPPQSL